MLMEVPLNIIHDYIGAPVLLGLGIDAMRRYRKNRNSTSLFLSLACLVEAIGLMGLGLPVLFTHDPQLLSLGTFVGDTAFALSMMFIWIICIRAFLGKYSRAQSIAGVLIGALVIVSFATAAARYLRPPYDSVEVIRSSGSLALTYKDTLTYTIVNGLNSIALVLLAIFLWRQGRDAPDIGQRLRIRGLAFSFCFIASAFLIVPALPVENQLRVSVLLWSLAFIVIGVFGTIGGMLSRKQQR